MVVLQVGLAGCEESELQKVDQVATGAEKIIDTGGDVIDSPAGRLIPPGIRESLILAGFCLSGLANGWQAYRKKQTEDAVVELASEVPENARTAATKKIVAKAVKKIS